MINNNDQTIESMYHGAKNMIAISEANKLMESYSQNGEKEELKEFVGTAAAVTGAVSSVGAIAGIVSRMKKASLKGGDYKWMMLSDKKYVELVKDMSQNISGEAKKKKTGMKGIDKILKKSSIDDAFQVKKLVKKDYGDSNKVSSYSRVIAHEDTELMDGVVYKVTTKGAIGYEGYDYIALVNVKNEAVNGGNDLFFVGYKGKNAGIMLQAIIKQYGVTGQQQANVSRVQDKIDAREAAAKTSSGTAE
jgi:hypothetical protein